MRAVGAIILLQATACGVASLKVGDHGDAGQEPDAAVLSSDGGDAGQDAGTLVADAGVDAGSPTDAGQPFDAGGSDGAGVSEDAGVAFDAGWTPWDAGTTGGDGGFINSICRTPDPGGDLFRCDSRVIIINEYQYRSTHLPGCAGLVTTDFNQCRFMGSIRDEVYAVRLDYKGVQPVAIETQFSLATVTIDDMPSVLGKYKSFILAVSELPGDFLPANPACRRTTGSGSQTLMVKDSRATNLAGACPLTPNTRYYMNVRPELPGCGFPQLLEPGEGTASVDCRVALDEGLPW